MDTIRSTGGVFLLATVLALAAGGPGAGNLSAQTVTGRVIEEGSERGMALVSIEAFGPEDEALGSARTDESGNFTLRLTRPAAVFRIDARAFTYRARTIESLSVAAGETLILDPIEMSAVPVILNSITATIERPLVTRGAEWVRQGQLTGRGTFVAGAILRLIEPPSLTEYLAERAGLRLQYNMWGVPYLRSDGGLNTCVRVQLNRWPLGSTAFPTMDMIPLDRIAAIEIYNTYRDVPDALIWDADECGLVNIWSWDSY